MFGAKAAVASALASLVNSTVVFTVPAAGVAIDPATGNVLPNTEKLAYTLFLRKVFTEQTTSYPGVDTRSAVYEGYCIEPNALDSRVKGGTPATIAFAGDPEVTCEVEDARFGYGSTGLIGSVLQDVLGTKIRLLATWQGNG